MSAAEPLVLAESVKKKLKPGKLSINGREELDAGALDQYTNVKSVWVALS